MKLSYQEIEDILKFKLPESAFTHRAFWANTTTRLIALRGLSVNDMAVEVNLETPCFAVQTIFRYNFTHDDPHLFISGCFFKNSVSFRKQYIYLSIVIETNQARGFIKKKKSCFI